MSDERSDQRKSGGRRNREHTGNPSPDQTSFKHLVISREEMFNRWLNAEERASALRAELDEAREALAVICANVIQRFGAYMTYDEINAWESAARGEEAE